MTPPTLEGYRHLDLLGTGGYSDVFLYEREFPRQRVAIKVLLAEAVDDDSRQRFTDEANLMASLSTHPYIVTVYEARISVDGRPYLVMEYYPRPNLHLRARSERFTAPAVLRMGVQVAAAIESAHRIGVLHRDIKPANILTSEYGRPGLTDFGIAVADAEGARGAEGMSIPWSPPEIVVGSGEGDVRSDVYSLGATLWTVLAGGRSPFEAAGESNRSIDLLDRIERGTVPAIDRPDVPDSLQWLLAQTMAKERRGRPASAAELARALQVIEVEQRFDMTPFEISEDLPRAPAEGEPIDADAGSTRVKDLGVIESQAPIVTPPHRTARSDRSFRPSDQAALEASARDPGRPSPVAHPAVPRSGDIIASTPYVPTDPPPAVLGPAPAPVPTGGSGSPIPSPRVPVDSGDDLTRAAVEDEDRSGPSVAVIVGVLAGILVAVLVAMLVVGSGADDPAETAPPTTVSPPPTVESVTVESVGPARGGIESDYIVRWDAPEGFEKGDTYTLTGDTEAEDLTVTQFELKSTTPQICVQVRVVRDGVAGELTANPGC